MSTAVQKVPAEAVVEMFFATDRRAWDDVRSSFTDTVWLDYTSLNGGEPGNIAADDMVDTWKGVLPGFDATHHHVTPVSTTPSDGGSTVILNGIATHRLASVHGDSLWTIGGYYETDLVTEADVWQIARFTFVATWGSGNRGWCDWLRSELAGPCRDHDTADLVTGGAVKAGGAAFSTISRLTHGATTVIDLGFPTTFISETSPWVFGVLPHERMTTYGHGSRRSESDGSRKS